MFEFGSRQVLCLHGFRMVHSCMAQMLEPMLRYHGAPDLQLVEPRLFDSRLQDGCKLTASSIKELRQRAPLFAFTALTPERADREPSLPRAGEIHHSFDPSMVEAIHAILTAKSRPGPGQVSVSSAAPASPDHATQEDLS